MLQDSNNDSIPKTDSDRNRNKKTSKYILCQGKIISGSTLSDKYKLHAEHINKETHKAIAAPMIPHIGMKR